MKNAKNIRNVLNIIQNHSCDKLVVVVSALGKTTNALEKVYGCYIERDMDAFKENIGSLIQGHLDIGAKLGLDKEEMSGKMTKIVSEAETALKECKPNEKAKIYDQIVSIGELFSTTMISSFFNAQSSACHWQDIREIIVADNHYRKATVDFVTTQNNVNSRLLPLIDEHHLILTQGFIARSGEGQTITLGREGSDYTAAILAHCLDIESLAIWKDVPGVLTADPRRFDNVEKIDKMSYKEAIEMTYYGAQVIHPKTIRPLQNKGIKLHVKSFVEPEAEGTVISSEGIPSYPPIVVIQDDVTLLQISSRDFSFIAENHLSRIFEVLHKLGIRLCTMRNSAISFSICIKDPGEDDLVLLKESLSSEFTIEVFQNLQLYTIRHFKQNLIDGLMKNKVILFEEKMEDTIQMAVRPALQLKEKS